MKAARQTVFQWIYRISKPYLWSILLLAIISGVIALGYIWLALISSAILDISTGHRDGSIWVCVYILFGLIIVQALMNGVQSYLRVRISGRMEMAMKQSLFSSLSGKQYVQLSGLHSGEFINRFTSDVQVVINNVVLLVPLSISTGTKLIAGFMVMTRISPEYASGIAVAALLLYVLGRLLSRRLKYLHKQCQSTDGQTRSFIQECMENIIVIKAFRKDNAVNRKLGELQQANYMAKVKRNTVNIVANTSFFSIVTMGYFATLTWGALQISKGTMTFGGLAAFLQILEQIRAPIRNMSGITPKYYAMLASAERLQELEQMEDEPVQKQGHDPAALYEAMKWIKFRQVSYGYRRDVPEAHLVFDNVELTIRKGEFVGIAGASGRGKSTLLKLLIGLLQPDRGAIFLVAADRKVEPAACRSLFAYVPQSNRMFSGTIRENMTLFNSSATDEEIEHALRLVCLREEKDQLPNGLDTHLGERGMGISEGQAQRLAIARAVISNSPILLLDECTSALDARTELEVLRRLRTLPDRTVICITHSLAALASCDRVVELDQWKPAEESCYGA